MRDGGKGMRVANPKCQHCNGTGRVSFDDIPGDIFECQCTDYPRSAKEMHDLLRDCAPKVET
jgi:hypothetical protein